MIAAGAWYFISSGTHADNELVSTGDAVAVVNGEEISRVDFEAFKSQVVAQQGIDIASLDAEIQSQFDAQIVDELIAQTLLQQAVKRSGVVASQEDVDAQIDATVARLGGDDAFEQALAAEELSEEEFRAQISSDLATRTYLEQELSLSSVTATNEEVEAAYAQAAAQNESIPQLEDVRPQVEQSLIQQKQQSLFVQFMERLRADVDVEVLL